MIERKLIAANIDQLPVGTWVYSAAGVALGIVASYLEGNGNRPAKLRRHLVSGSPKDRYAYRRCALYREAKAAGAYVLASDAARQHQSADNCL